MAERMPSPNVFRVLVPDGWQNMTFEPFREGVEICHLGRGGPDVALLRYAPGASVPRHRHQGLEVIIVLSGSQSDDHGRYRAGDVVLNPKGSEHEVWSVDGCTVLIQSEHPVTFVD